MTTQAVQFAYKPGYRIRHIETDQMATVLSQKVKTVAPGKLEPMYRIELDDGTVMNATQKELVVIIGGATKPT
jgi:hypothetical protein